MWLRNWCANRRTDAQPSSTVRAGHRDWVDETALTQVSTVKPTVFGTECWVPTPVSSWTSSRKRPKSVGGLTFWLTPEWVPGSK